MSSLTIHSLDATLDQKLNEEARRSNKSKNQLVKDLLAASVGLPVAGRYADDYREFCGLWTAAERASFDAAQDENERVDAGDWPA